MKMFKTGRAVPSNVLIQEMDMQSSTGEFVTHRNGETQGRQTTHAQFFDTWEAAKRHLVRGAEEGLKIEKRQVDVARSFLERVKSLRAKTPNPNPGPADET